ncbi:MAG: hypothetical protein K2N67_02300, partial [Mucispirillum sp.]|nr:hypothetical protein [Mucispirillum sp.]
LTSEPKLFTNSGSSTGFYLDEYSNLYITGRHFYERPVIMSAGLSGKTTTFSKYNKFTKIEEVSKVKKAVGAETHILILTQDGDVYVWGYDIFTNSEDTYSTHHYGVLGLGKAPEGAPEEEEAKYYEAAVPVKLTFPNDAKIKDIASYAKKTYSGHGGGETGYNIAVGENNEIYVWGTNKSKALGEHDDAEDGIIWEPKLMDDQRALDDLNIEKIVIENGANIVLTDSGDIYGWGINKYGLAYLLGIDDNRSNIFPPEKIEVLDTDNNPVKVKDISAASSNVLLLGGDNYAYMFGIGCKGVEFDRTEYTCPILSKIKVPSRVLAPGSTDNTTFMPEVSFIATGAYGTSNGYDTSIAIGSDGSIYGWGNNNMGQLGIKDYYSYNDTQGLEHKKFNIPQDLKKTEENYQDLSHIDANYQKPVPQWHDKNFKSIYIGKGFTYAMDENGAMYSWGSNSEGQLGIGEIKDDNGEITGEEATYRMQKIEIER